MRFRNAALGWGVLAVTALLGVDASRAMAETARVAGRVIDAQTLAPIAGAEVELGNSSGGQGYYRAKTDAQGQFKLEGIALGRYYTLNVGIEGYADFVLGGWQIPDAQREAQLVIPLDRAGVIEVKVTAADGKTPVAGARVGTRTEGGSMWWEGDRGGTEPVFTDRTGIARFKGLTAGYYTVSVDAAGLLANETRRVAVRRGETTVTPIALFRPASLAGRVKLADASGVSGVTVTARGPAEGVGTSGSDGFFSIGDLPPGRFRVEPSHEGFTGGALRDMITLTEGESRAGIELTVTPKAPELAFVLQREVFAPDQPLRVGLRSFRIGTVDLTLFQIANERLLDARNDFRRYATGVDTAGLSRVDAWTHRTADGPPFSWREEELPLRPGLAAQGSGATAPSLAPGVYLLRGRAGKLERRVIFFVSDLGLLVKRSATRVLVSAASLRTGMPVKNAAVFLVSGGTARLDPSGGEHWGDAVRAAQLARAVTDADGMVMLNAPGGTNALRVIAASEVNGTAVAESPLSGAAQQGGDQLFLFTERPIYRPGQTVYWKAFARKGAGTGYVMPDHTSTRVSVHGPDGATVDDVASPALSPSGGADGAIVLPKELPLGEWTLNVSAGTASSSAVFAVEEYRKPEFSVDVTPDRETYVNGDEVRFNVAASYFFGAPVFGATVRYNLYESRLSGEGSGNPWDDGEGGGDGEASAGYGRVLKSGETRTDVDGRASLVFTPERVAYDRRLTLEVEVVDGASRQVSARGSAIMGRGLFTIALQPASRMVIAGSAPVVEVITRDLAGKPVSAAVTVDLDQDVWNPLERRYTRSNRPLASVVSTTNAQGRSRVTIAPGVARSGYLLVRARARDAKGNLITAETSFWVYDARVWEYAYRYPALEAFPERARYAPGDTLKILVNTDVRDAAVLATVEGRELRDWKITHLFGNTGLVTFVVKPEDAPNAFVAIHVRKGKEVHTRVLEIPVAAERHDLAITLTPDREKYRPQDAAKIGIDTRDAAGRPVPAEVAIGVVDEAIYSLRADNTPDPHDVFYGRRPNWVTTVVSFPTLYYGGADKGGRDEPRKDFRDVAMWEPTVRTDANGHAEVTFKYPDNLTTWRATARGVSDATLVGRGVVKTLVTKEVVARLAGPRFFIAGDEAALVSNVNNRSGAPLTGVTESIEASGAAKITGAASRQTSVATGGESRSTWSVTVPADAVKKDDASATFTFRAKSKADSDALEVVVPTLPRAVPLRVHAAGAMDAKAGGTPTVATLTLPSNLVPSGSSVTLAFSPSPAAMSLGAIDFLVDFPYGCTEQTANAILPACELLTAARAAGVTVPGWEDPQRKLAPFLDRLATLQSPQGGWGWWPGNDPDPYMTALALDALAQAEKLELTTGASSGLLQQNLYAMGRLLSDVRIVDGEAYCAAHLVSLFDLKDAATRFTDWKGPLAERTHSLYEQRDRLGVAGLALTARACAKLGQPAEAKALLELLMKRSVREASGLSFPSDPDAADTWFGDAAENTGYALSALAEVAPADPRAADLVRWLGRRRQGRAWASTRTTAPVAIGLAGYLRTHLAEMKPSYQLRAEWNGESVLERAIAPADAFGASALRVAIPGSKLRAGANALRFTANGSGSLYWSAQARAMVPSPGPPSPSDRLRVKREYFQAVRTADRRGRPRWLVNALDPKAAIKVGESILVRLTLDSPKGMRWVMVEDPRAAGFEIDQLKPEGANWPYGMHAESRDQRAVFFVDALEAGETVIEYLVRPEIAGRFTSLPTSAGPMYDPDVVVRSAEARLVIEAK